MTKRKRRLAGALAHRGYKLVGYTERHRPVVLQPDGRLGGYPLTKTAAFVREQLNQRHAK